MKTPYINIRYVGVAALLLALLALSACGGPAAAPGPAQATSTPESSTAQVPTLISTLAPGPGQAAPTPTLTPGPTQAAPAATASGTPGNAMQGFTSTPFPLPDGFPILPEAQFVAYNPAFDPCSQGPQACPPKVVALQVWLYEVPVPANSMGPAAPQVVVAGRYAALLKAAGYQVETQIEPGVATLTFTGPASSSVGRGSIVVGPSVSDHTPPAGMMLIGLRISIEHHQMK